ncbi:hypothetical protein M885DRAFT_522114 [Pelagophyceae sp. CCMP2097]|nr:hypothetical protein M885DRAFT_522114 [Pelagophyceae sp. CCMP2097]
MPQAEPRWQVVAFRCLRDGDVEDLKRLCVLYPHLIHERFTKDLHDWELEFDSLKWYQFREATCLFIAAAHGRHAVVEWLLENGVDESEQCYMGLAPADVIGDARCDSQREADLIRNALKRPKRAPRAPLTPTFAMKLAHEEKTSVEYINVKSDDPRRPDTRQAKRITDVVLRVIVDLSWYTPWLRPGIEYELKYRVAKDEGGKSDEKWTTENTTATKRRVTGLLPGELYAVEVRARNAVGPGPTSPLLVLKTPGAKEAQPGDKEETPSA